MFGIDGWLRSGVAVVCLAVLGAAPAQAADAEAGKGAYAVCAACHGPQGEGNAGLNAPKISGQESWYLRRQMQAYQQGIRGTAPGDVHGMQMRPMAMTVMAPDALENLIAYIGTFPDVPAAPTIEGDVAAGKTAYAVCAACHGPQAQGVEQLAGPKLAGQNDWYLIRQINNYKQGLRAYDPKDIYGNQMKPMASVLANDKAVLDVTAYINTLR
jgi:cytochrome c oxidase subunit II